MVRYTVHWNKWTRWTIHSSNKEKPRADEDFIFGCGCQICCHWSMNWLFRWSEDHVAPCTMPNSIVCLLHFMREGQTYKVISSHCWPSDICLLAVRQRKNRFLWPENVFVPNQYYLHSCYFINNYIKISLENDGMDFYMFAHNCFQTVFRDVTFIKLITILCIKQIWLSKMKVGVISLDSMTLCCLRQSNVFTH